MTLRTLAVLAAGYPILALPSELFDSSIATKLRATYQAQPPVPTLWPQYTFPNGTWRYFAGDTWTTGFFPATMYAMAERAELCPELGLNASEWIAYGRGSSSGEIPGSTLSTKAQSQLEHDVGFVSFPFQQELLVNPSNDTAKSAVQSFASSLASRFNPLVGCTRSWDNTTDSTDFEVIIDNMINLELFFASNDLQSNQTLIDMATSHANKTIVNHVREDGSSFHVVDYNSTTGEVIRQRTSQGYADNSTWSRGQAWGIYGFAQMYNLTGIADYLTTSRRMAKYFIDHIPEDGVVPWDFNAPVDGRPADTSAAMVATNGLLLLSQQETKVNNGSGASYYQSIAQQILTNTTEKFWKPEFQSLLSNGTVNNPANPPNNETGIVYGDYYFITAGNELVKQGLASCNGTSISSNSSSSGSTSSPGASGSTGNSGAVERTAVSGLVALVAAGVALLA
ncbi:glycoside hydrolase family 88 protein [Peniophora sp. CONT]|nr:glycoside hydrolase family 88 protein [Peniophora sp. CONT]